MGTEVGDGERGAGQLGGREWPGAGCLGQPGGLDGDLGEALAVGVEDGRQRSGERHADVYP